MRTLHAEFDTSLTPNLKKGMSDVSCWQIVTGKQVYEKSVGECESTLSLRIFCSKFYGVGVTEQQRREREHQEDLRRLRDFCPIDDDFICCLLKDNVPLAELVLRIIIGKKDLVIIDCQTQKDMKRLAEARSICLEAYGTDSENKKYDCEIQRADKGTYPHCTRYYSIVLDIENLDAGHLYYFYYRKRFLWERGSNLCN